jgi:chemotaxis protein MotA
MKISYSTLFGVVAGSAVVGWGIQSLTSNWKMFLDWHAAAIVIGGTITATFIGYRWRYISLALKDIFTIFVGQDIGPRTLPKDIKMVIQWAEIMQNEGKKGAEKIATESKDKFVIYLFGLLGTGYSEDEIRDFASTNIEEHYFRHLSECNILAAMASAAPAMGMVGTLIGMIVMLSSMADPSAIGPGLAVALVATLYGVLSARFIFLPTSTKVKQKLGIQRFREYLLLEGVALIIQKRSSFFIQDKLNSYLDRDFQYKQGTDKA